MHHLLNAIPCRSFRTGGCAELGAGTDARELVGVGHRIDGGGGCVGVL